MNSNKSLVWIIVLVVAAVIAYFAFDMRVNDTGELPRVDASVEGGRLPDVDVRGPQVEVGTKKTEVTVPTGIETEKREITTPTVDVDLPKDTKGTAD
jgi:hypothetical protein